MSPRVLALYRTAPRLTKAHLRIRWWTCPFGRVADHVPEGRILEIGCGHGLFSNHLALASPTREVVGVDIDDGKIEAATRTGTGARFQVAPPGEVPVGPWDGIVIVDVLYLISPEDQTTLLSAAAAQLSTDGALIIKEMARTPRWKAAWNRVQEFLSVRVLHITAGERIHQTDPAFIRRCLEDQGLTVEARRIDRGYPHPHHLTVGRYLDRRATPGSV